MTKIYLSLFLLVIAFFSTAVLAQPAPEKSLDAIVEIRITVPENAPTAERFGTSRVASGVVIDPEGHILTIGFQTIDAENIEIVAAGDQKVTATVVCYDRQTGFGLLRAVSPLSVTPMPLGDSSQIKKGDPALAASFGGTEAVQGVVVIDRKEFAGPWEYLLEDAVYTAPAIAQFSGAALINRKGHLVGIGYLLNQVVIAEMGLVQVNMFVPTDLLKPILSEMKRSGTSGQPPKPWLGIRTEEAYGRLFVERVIAGGPAEKAGIGKGDIVLAVNRQAVTGMADFYRKVWVLGEAGVEVPVSILKGIEIRQVVIRSTLYRPERRPPEKEKTPDAKL